jgi:hypothetical protein
MFRISEGHRKACVPGEDIPEFGDGASLDLGLKFRPQGIDLLFNRRRRRLENKGLPDGHCGEKRPQEELNEIGRKCSWGSSLTAYYAVHTERSAKGKIYNCKVGKHCR